MKGTVWCGVPSGFVDVGGAGGERERQVEAMEGKWTQWVMCGMRFTFSANLRWV